MPAEKTVEELKAEIEKLQKQVSELSDEKDELWLKNRSLESAARGLQSENDKLLAIIDNLSKGFAALGDRK